MDYDIGILGAGPGGYVAAIRASQLGARVCVMEKDKLGGTCLNWGCIPTKALLYSAEQYIKFKNASSYGISYDNLNINMAQMMKHKDSVVNRLVQGINMLMKKNGIDLIQGHGRFLSSKEIKIETEEGEKYISAENIIIASGTTPAMPAIFGYDGNLVCSSNEALTWNELPDKLVIVGGGVIGCEFATLYNALGVEVTIVEMLPQIIANFDNDLSKAVLLNLKKKGINVITGVSVEKINKTGYNAQVLLSDGNQLSVDKILVAIGRKPCTDNLNLEYLDIKIDENTKKIIVDDKMQTSLENIYAIGDVCSSPLDLAHVASREGIMAAESIMGKEAHMDYHCIPNCVFTIPEIATVGMTKEEAQEAGKNVKTGRFNYIGNGKALSMGEKEGFIKLIVDADTDELLGAQMYGAHTSDMIAEAAVVVQNHGTCSQIADTIHAHPTIAETVWEASEAAQGKAIHS